MQTRKKKKKNGTSRQTTEPFASGIWKRKGSLTTVPLQTGTARWTLGTHGKAPCFPSEAFWRLPGYNADDGKLPSPSKSQLLLYNAGPTPAGNRTDGVMGGADVPVRLCDVNAHA